MRHLLPGLALCGLVLAACGDNQALSRADVEGLPAGDATGSALSGQYQLDLHTTACQGTCPLIDMGWYSLATCDVGHTDSSSVEVTQTDGRLVVVGDGLLVERMEGGVDQGGSFKVGGYGTQNSGSLEVVTLVHGTMDAEGQIAARSETHAWGEINGTGVNCTALFDVTGQR